MLAMNLKGKTLTNFFFFFKVKNYFLGLMDSSNLISNLHMYNISKLKEHVVGDFALDLDIVLKYYLEQKCYLIVAFGSVWYIHVTLILLLFCWNILQA